MVRPLQVSPIFVPNSALVLDSDPSSSHSMKGSTVDAMSEAVDNAEVMLFCVSLAYKESANCRLECQYGHQQEVSMIPLMMEEGYRPTGWLGLLLGARL